jgi:hypothetical protein
MQCSNEEKINEKNESSNIYVSMSKKWNENEIWPINISNIS